MHTATETDSKSAALTGSDDWMRNDIVSCHSERAGRVYDRLEAKGFHVMEYSAEDWVNQGRVNLRKESGVPYFHTLYTKTITLTAAKADELEATIAASVTIERYGQNGEVRNSAITVGAPQVLNYEPHWVWYKNNRSWLKQAGYLSSGRYIRVVEDSPQALTARLSLGMSR